MNYIISFLVFLVILLVWGMSAEIVQSLPGLLGDIIKTIVEIFGWILDKISPAVPFFAVIGIGFCIYFIYELLGIMAVRKEIKTGVMPESLAFIGGLFYVLCHLWFPALICLNLTHKAKETEYERVKKLRSPFKKLLFMKLDELNTEYEKSDIEKLLKKYDID